MYLQVYAYQEEFYPLDVFFCPLENLFGALFTQAARSPADKQYCSPINFHGPFSKVEVFGKCNKKKPSLTARCTTTLGVRNIKTSDSPLFAPVFQISEISSKTGQNGAGRCLQSSQTTSPQGNEEVASPKE